MESWSAGVLVCSGADCGRRLTGDGVNNPQNSCPISGILHLTAGASRCNFRGTRDDQRGKTRSVGDLECWSLDLPEASLQFSNAQKLQFSITTGTGEPSPANRRNSRIMSKDKAAFRNCEERSRACNSRSSRITIHHESRPSRFPAPDSRCKAGAKPIPSQPKLRYSKTPFLQPSSSPSLRLSEPAKLRSTLSQDGR